MAGFPSQLPLGLDPLIAEAKRRARRRWIVLAAVLLLVGGGAATAGFFAYQHESRRAGPAVPLGVLVATRVIIQGTTGDGIRQAGHYKLLSIPRSQMEDGAILNPAMLAGKVALYDIFPGQQLTASQFGPCACIATPSGSLRAVILPSPKVVEGRVTPGSHVDVLVARHGELRELYRNMSVLNVSDAGGKVTLKATLGQAGGLIYATDTHQSIVLRVRRVGS